MLPGFSSDLIPQGHENEGSAKLKRYMTMMDSMTNEGMHNELIVEDANLMHTIFML